MPKSVTDDVPAMTPEQMEIKRLELMERQIALQEQQAAALSTQVERTAPRENPNYRPSGPTTNPATGEPWTKELTVDIYHNNIHLNRSPLTEAEVRQLQRLQPLERGTIQKADRSVADAKVIPTFAADGTITRLRIEHPMGRDHTPQHYPPLDELAKQLADQAEAVVA